MPSPAFSIAEAQKLRLARMRWGLLYQLCTQTLALVLALLGLVPWLRFFEYVAAASLVQLGIYACIKSGFNLRFADPSLTALQISLPLWPTIYLMYFVPDPQTRMAFLMLATGGLLFGMFALNLRGMLKLGAMIVFAYLILLVALWQWSPGAINPTAEVAIVLAYVTVLGVVAYLGSFIASLRISLKARNQALQEAMAKLEDLATRDPLTSLPNRRSVMEQLAREKSRVERRAPELSSLCVAILDVDHFKQVNDTYGHLVGDAVLQRIGQGLQAAIRQGDFVGRYGGEEFLLILPESNPEGALIAAERIREHVGRLVHPELPTDTQVTVSLGLAIHRPGASLDDTLKEADDALYQAKSQGRNQVLIAP